MDQQAQLLDDLKMYWKYFVRAAEPDQQQHIISSRNSEIKPADGNEIKQFYEEIIKSPTEQISKNKPSSVTQLNRLKIKHKPVRIKHEEKPLNINEFFKSAQYNEVDRLKEFLKSGFDVNMTDSFGWTALMCASAQGAAEAVDFLTKNGACLSITDKSGRNAKVIADKSGHINISKQLSQNEMIKNRKKVTNLRRNDKKDGSETFHCDICDEKFERTTPRSHRTSTLHLFCTEPERKSNAVYQIPEHNVGFRLLLKDGWDREKGLGPKEDGRKYPVKTVLKRDRKGLGKGDKNENVARVTHFSPGDVKAVENVYRKTEQRKLMTKSQRRKLENRRERIETKKEKEFRRMFKDVS